MPRPTGVVDTAARRTHVTDALDGVNTSKVGNLGVVVDVQDDGGHGAVFLHGVAQVLSEQKCGTIGDHERSLRSGGATPTRSSRGGRVPCASVPSSHGQRAIHRDPTLRRSGSDRMGRTYRLEGP